MIRSIVGLAILTGMLSACSWLGSGTQSDTATPVAPLSADELLRRSDEAMRELTFVSVAADVRPTVSGRRPYHDELEFRGPRCLRNARSAAGPPTANCPCGWTELTAPYAHYFDRASGGVFGPGPQLGATTATGVRYLRWEKYDGRHAYVIAYEFKAASVEGPFNVFRTEWIDASTFLLLRQEQEDDDPFGVRAHVTATLSEFDAKPAPPCE